MPRYFLASATTCWPVTPPVVAPVVAAVIAVPAALPVFAVAADCRASAAANCDPLVGLAEGASSASCAWISEIRPWTSVTLTRGLLRRVRRGDRTGGRRRCRRSRGPPPSVRPPEHARHAPRAGARWRAA